MNSYEVCVCSLAAILLCVVNLSDGYRTIRLQDYLCSDKLIITLQKPFRGDPTFTLTEHRDSAAVISQTWNATLPGVYSSNNLKYDCRFRVKTTDKSVRGIYTVITRLKFRQDPVTGACWDYIQFLNGNQSPSERMCNDISNDGSGRINFDHRDRDVSIHIHIDKRHMIHEPLELNMVITAHSDCRMPDDFHCDPENPYMCISKQFVRDNVTTCMYAVTAKEIDTTNVALSAITSLIFTMLGVGFCVWICWKYWNCITVQQHAHEASAAAVHQRGPRDTLVIELPTEAALDHITTINQHYPQQQPLQQQQQQQLQQQQAQQPQTPKDLPPSYESLFPDR